MAEWLGSALQKLLQRFESASDLNEQKESPVIIAIAGLSLILCVYQRVYMLWISDYCFRYQEPFQKTKSAA